MIMWRGWGILTPFIIFGVLVLNQSIVRAIGGESLWRAHLDQFAGLGVFAGGLVALLVRLFLLKTETRELLDVKTGQKVELTNHHDIFWIDVKWWSALTMVLGAAMMTGAFQLEPSAQ